MLLICSFFQYVGGISANTVIIGFLFFIFSPSDNSPQRKSVFNSLCAKVLETDSMTQTDSDLHSPFIHNMSTNWNDKSRGLSVLSTVYTVYSDLTSRQQERLGAGCIPHLLQISVSFYTGEALRTHKYRKQSWLCTYSVSEMCVDSWLIVGAYAFMLVTYVTDSCKIM